MNLRVETLRSIIGSNLKIEVFIIALLCLALANAQTILGASSGAKRNDPVLVGAGDIASCDDLSGAYATAKLIEKISGTVFAAGDLAYPNGSDEGLCEVLPAHVGAIQGQLTRPAPGNQVSQQGGSPGYVPLFRFASWRSEEEGYYSYDLGVVAHGVTDSDASK